MPFAKGKQKTGGRSKGSLNQKTIDQKQRAESLMQLLENDYLQKDIANLTSLQRTDFYLGLMEYVSPKLRRVDGTLNANLSFANEKVEFS